MKDFANFLKAEGANVNESKLSRVAGVDSSVFTIKAVGEAIGVMLGNLSKKKPAALLAERRKKFLDMGSKGLAA